MIALLTVTAAAFRLAGGRIALGLAAGLALCLSLAPASAMTIERVKSPGGIEAWVVRDAAVPLIAVDFTFGGGSDQDPKDKAGLASLAASLLDEGAGSLDSKAFQEKLERRAIELSFRASRDSLRGTLRTLKENRDEAFDALRLALNEPRFDAEAIERMRAQTLSQLRRSSTNPNDIGSRTWWANAFPNQPYGQPTTGTPETVAAIGADDLRGYTRRVLARDNLKIAIVGDIDLETAGKLLDSTFGALPAKAELTPVANVAPQGMGRRIVVELDVPQAVIMFGGPGVARNDPDFMAAYVVNHILGGGSFSSRLYSEVREKRGLAYGISTSLVWLKHSAVLLGGTATRADAVAETLKIIETEFKRLATEGPTEDELAKTKTFLIGSFPLGLDTSSKIAAQLVQMQTDNLGIDYIERRPAMIESITLADAKRAAKRLLDAGLLVTVVGRPQGVTSN
jgi:zinc protease